MKVFKDKFVKSGFQFEVNKDNITIRNRVTSMYFILDDKELQLLDDAITHYKHSVISEESE